MLITLFLCGDLMIGRGVDQIQRHSAPPTLHEPHITDARDYVTLAERASGPIPRDVEPQYLWGEALAALRRFEPDARIVNLETALTTHDRHDPDKGIHYRAHPINAEVLSAAGIDVASLANNHVLDWREPGLRETLQALENVGVSPVGAGTNEPHAEAPVELDVPGPGRLLVFAFGMPSSGVPRDWAAGPNKPGVNFLPEPSELAAERIIAQVDESAGQRDAVVVSVHWGGNWGYEVPQAQRRFAHRLIDSGRVDVVHGHSSHHVKGIEVYKDRLILYGCGDFLNDYEGIGGHERYRPELTLAYFPALEPGTGRLKSLRMVPLRIRRLQLQRADEGETIWLRKTLNTQSQAFGVSVRQADDGTLHAEWGQ